MKRKIIVAAMLLVSSTTLAQFWNDNGNIVTPANWLGTQNNQPLNIRTNGIQAMTISNINQSVGINTPFPLGRLGVEENNGPVALNVRNSSPATFPSNIGIITDIGSGAAANEQLGLLSTVQVTNRGFGGSFNLSTTPTTAESYGVYAQVSTNPNVND